MNNDTVYSGLIVEIPQLEEIRTLYGADPIVWQSMVLAIYRQGRVDQLSEWCKGRLKDGTNS